MDTAVTPHQCVMPHRDDRPVRATPGLHLCPGHHRRLAEDLDALPALYDDLADRLTGTTTGTTGRVTGTTTPGLHLDPEVARVRAEIRDRLISWTRAVCEERGLLGPSDPAPHTLAAWLSGADRVDWCAGQDWADEYADDIGRLARDARGLLQPSGSRRFKVAPCPQTVQGDDGQQTACTGTIYAVLRAADSLLPSELACSTCGTTWPAREWSTLGRHIKGAA